MIGYVITAAVSFYAGLETAGWVLDLSEKIDEKNERVHLESIARWFGIKAGVDWSDKRAEDFYRTVLAKLGYDPEVRKVCARIEDDVRANQDRLNA